MNAFETSLAIFAHFFSVADLLTCLGGPILEKGKLTL
jgi:hypothetical protein